MKINVERGALLKALNHVQSVVERRNTIPILSNVLIEAAKGELKLTATDLDIEIVEALPADVLRNGSATAPAHMLYDIVRKLPEGAQVQAELLASEGGRLAVSAGTSRFELSCLPREDFPQMTAGTLPHKFRLAADDLKRIIDKTRFAISTEETRYYLNGIYVHAAKDGKLPMMRAVATDGHRLARYELELPDGASDMPGVIVPRKTVGELRKLLDDAEGAIDVSLSDTKIQFGFNGVELTSKLIDGNFPPYERVIPSGNDKSLALEAKEFAQSVDRVSTISADKTRAVKLNLSKDKVTLSVVNPESGTATEDVGATYSAGALEIGFNARYLLDITSQIEGKEVRFLLSDAGSPAIIEDVEDARTLYVLMPLESDHELSDLTVALDMRPGWAEHSRLAVTRLHLTNFRSYAVGELNVSGAPVVLAGPNGAGKTNILDAISLLSPGRGLRGAKLAEHTRKGPVASEETLWAVAATVARGGTEYEIGTGLTQASASRQVRLNGVPAQSSADLGDIVQLIWLTPAMDRLFIESAGGRRRFLDRLVLGFDTAHARSATRYETAMRERARLLKYGPRDPAWLDGLENEMAEAGIQIAQARAATVEKLSRALAERGEAGLFPAASLNLTDELHLANADDLRSRLAAGRMRDAEAGRALEGPHATDLAVRHTAKRADARDCSTGEQKALLISIILADARELARVRQGMAPILLLDEIAAHLDAVRRAALFEEIYSLAAQAWMTGTDLSLFSGARCEVFEVCDSQFLRQSETA